MLNLAALSVSTGNPQLDELRRALLQIFQEIDKQLVNITKQLENLP
jgi:hypothetical protein